LRRIAVIATALIVLGISAAAYAATQPYTGSLTFTSKQAGTTKKPAPIGFTLKVKSTAPAGTRPPVQLDIKVKTYGVRVDGKDFPSCSLAKIAAAHNDTVCPKGALIASGYIQSLLGSATNFSSPGANCDPLLHVWNSGQGKETYFFLTDATHVCAGGLKTGSTPPYPGTYKVSGKYFITDVNVPKYIDYPLPGIVGSLQYEQLKFTTQSKKVKGKTLVSQSSVACLKNKRPYSIITTTTGGSEGPGNHVNTISGSAPCKS
jgi:hypothetical protein